MKDWMQEAASSIASVFSDTPSVSAMWVHSEILKYCPFKPNVAYMPVIRIAPGNIQDWASKAAEYLSGDKRASTEHVAAVIATFAEPLVKALEASRREHNKFSCVKLSDASCNALDIPYDDCKCTCGADAHNAMIDEALS